MTNKIFAKWKKLRNKVESTSARLYLEKNEQTEKEYEEAIEALAQYEKDNGIPLMADEARVKAMLPKSNFDRVTASPEKLVKFVFEAEMFAVECVNRSDCDNCKCQWCGLAGRPDIKAWLKQEAKE